MHIPVNKEAVQDVMPLLFKLLELEDGACIRGIQGYFMFVNIHPYMDGNGRMGRFIMNIMLASGGYRWNFTQFVNS